MIIKTAAYELDGRVTIVANEKYTFNLKVVYISFSFMELKDSDNSTFYVDCKTKTLISDDSGRAYHITSISKQGVIK